MTNSLRFGKKALTLAVAAATILWSVGFAAIVAPQSASAASFGDLIKGETLSTVYYYGSDGQRYAFPNEATYFSWYENFDGVTTISDEALADIALAGNVTYRPGARWIKITSDDKVYAVARDGSIHWVESEEVAQGLAGDNWNQFIDDVADVFFVDYTVGDSLISAEDGYDGLLVADGDDTYLIWDGEKRMVSAAGMSANRFQSRFVLSGSGVSLSGLSAGDDVDAELSLLTDTAQMVEEETYVEGADVNVSVSSMSPSSTTLVAGQGIADLARFTLSNPTDAAVTVKGFAVERTGVSSDTTLAAVYLFNGYERVSDSASVSSGTISWNDAGGLFTIPAGGSYELSVRSNIASSTSGQTIGLRLASADAVTFTGNYDAAGSFPMNSATHTVASVSNFGTVSFATTTTPSANSSVDPQNDYRVWENTVTVGNNESWLQSMRFRNIGSINADDIENWRLYVAGVQRGDAVAQQDEDGYLIFDLSDNPVMLNTGNHVVKVLADIVGGSTRTVTVGLRNSADAVFIEDDYDQPILVQANSSTFSARDAGAQTLASGTLTITKKSDSPSGDVTDAASNATLATFELKAFGENMKVESLRFYVNDSGNETAYTLRNGAIYADGVQIGSTTALAGDQDATLGYTEYTFGSSLIVEPGNPVVLEVRADIFDNDGSNDVSASTTLVVNVDNSSSSNVLRQTSGSYVSAPTSDVAGNTLTVRQGTVTVAENTSYADQTAVAPKTPYKLGSFSVSSSTTEAINLTQFDIDWTAADAADASDDLTNLYLMFGPASDMAQSSIKGSVADSDNQWSVDYTLDPNETIRVDVYADVASSVTDGDGTADTLVPTLTVSYTTVDSGTSSTDNSAGQTVTWGTGSFTPAIDGSTPVNRVVAANQEVEIGKFRFTSQNENYTIEDITWDLSSDGADASSVINELRLYDGSELVATTPINESTNTEGTMNDMGIAVASNTYKVLTLKAALNDIGTGAGMSHMDLKTKIETITYADSQGVESSDASTDPESNEVWAFKSVPTFTHVDLSNTTLVVGQAQDLYKFTVAADANASVAIKQFKLPISWTDGGTGGDTLEVESLKFYKNGSDITTSVVMQDEDGNSVESTSGLLEDDTHLVITFSSEDAVAAGGSNTYTVRGTPQGFNVTDGDATSNNDYFGLYLAGDSAENAGDVCLNDGTSTTSIAKLHDASSGACQAASGSATDHNLIWSDNSASGHASATNASSSTDWHNGYLLLNLDLSGETWSK